MWKNMLILLLVITISSCGSKKNVIDASKDSKEVVNEKDANVAYESLGNDVAEVKLYLKKNGSFQLNFKTLEAPVGQDDPVKLVYKGNYTSTETDGWKTLTFTHPDFVANGVFDSRKDQGIQIISDKIVKINTDKHTLSMWGLVCEKQ